MRFYVEWELAKVHCLGPIHIRSEDIKTDLHLRKRTGAENCRLRRDKNLTRAKPKPKREMMMMKDNRHLEGGAAKKKNTWKKHAGWPLFQKL